MATKSKLRAWTYGAGFLSELSLALVAYVGSSFLVTLVGEERVGLVYSAASVVALILLGLAPWLLRHGGWRRFLTASILGSLLSTVFLAISHNINYLLAAFVVFSALGLATKFGLDLELEALSSDGRTGKIRGIYLTIINAAWLLSPLLAGLLSDGGTYHRVYAASATVLLPLLIFSWRLFEPQPATTELPRPNSFFRHWPASAERRKNIILAISLDFWLNFFYAVMIIYTPIYLHNHIGFDWLTIGEMFTIMLLPFVILDYPLGRVADKWLGEKEIMIGGILLMALALTFISRLTTANFILWTGLLLLSRIGAASFEVMKESYLFKQIDSGHTHILSLSRNTYPLAYIIAPLAATAVLESFPFATIFSLLAVVMFLGLLPAVFLTDTK